MKDEQVVYAVSDSTGETASQACRAALAQFASNGDVPIRLFPNVLDDDALRAVLREARRTQGLVVYTLVRPGARARMRELARDAGVPAIDLLGGLIRDLGRHLGRAPRALPGAGYETDEAYFQRIEAIEFTVNQDDGRLPANLERADLVLVGISRTSKTPLSIYLAHRGCRVANVPIVLDLPPPAELDTVDPQRVFGLVVDPAVLVNIRRARMEAMGMPARAGYGDLDHVRREMAWARRVYQQHPGWTVLDTTRKAIEETASVVLAAWRERFGGSDARKAGRS